MNRNSKIANREAEDWHFILDAIEEYSKDDLERVVVDLLARPEPEFQATGELVKRVIFCID